MPSSRHIAAYERELIRLVLVVCHWRPYLWGHPFLIRTDHFSLKFLLDQKLSTIPQHQWASKFLGFNFRVEYKHGSTNVIADALSRRDTDEEAQLATLSTVSFDLFDTLCTTYDTDAAQQQLRTEVATGNRGDRWRVVDGLVTVAGRIHILAASLLVQVVVGTVHAMGHEGMEKTLHRLRSDFHIPGACAAVQEIVHACTTCQRNKTEQLHPAGLLQPLIVPTTVWADIAMDFIEGLSRVHGKSVILTVIDRFSKSMHFLPLGHPYIATTVELAFFDSIVWLHGIPSSIVSDPDPMFTSQFWRELFAMAGVQLNLSLAFHLQTDDQSEAANKIIIMYLRCLVGDRPRGWLKWLSWAEYCYNTTFQSSLRTLPFRVVYGRDPSSLHSYTQGEARLPAVQQQLLERDEFLLEVRD
jgi:hypothetical protein